MADEGGAAAAFVESQDKGAALEGPVLVAISLSAADDEVLQQGDALARDLSVPLLVCHVLPEQLQVRMLFPQFRRQDEAARRDLEERALRLVEARVVSRTGRADLSYRIRLESGSVHSAILRQADATRAGVVVVGPGSVAERVARHAAGPVLVARPSAPGSVLAATDLSDPAFPAVAAGAAEAARRGRPFVVLHSIDVVPAAVVTPIPEYPLVPLLSPTEMNEVRAAMRGRLEECLARVRASGTPLVTDGPPAHAIQETARTLPAELIVVGTAGRTGLTRVALGSVAEAVVRSAPCSTLVVRLGERL